MLTMQHYGSDGEPLDVTLDGDAADWFKTAINVVKKHGPAVVGAAKKYGPSAMSAFRGGGRPPAPAAPSTGQINWSVFGKKTMPPYRAGTEYRSQVQPTLAPVPAAAPYAGCAARYNTTRMVWSVYCPTGHPMTMSGFGDFGQATTPSVTPAPPGPLTTTTSTQPAGSTDAGQEQDTPFYKKPWFWLAVGGGVLVLGGGYYYMRKR